MTNSNQVPKGSVRSSWWAASSFAVRGGSSVFSGSRLLTQSTARLELHRQFGARRRIADGVIDLGGELPRNRVGFVGVVTDQGQRAFDLRGQLWPVAKPDD